jgi:hypothetical protein
MVFVSGPLVRWYSSNEPTGDRKPYEVSPR